MKKITTAISLMFFSTVALAQNHEPVNFQKEQMEFEGYTIRVLPAIGSTYGYGIWKGKRLVVYQTQNPFTFSHKGLTKKEDVYKLAQWQIKQLNEGKQFAPGKPVIQGREMKLSPALQQKLQMQASKGPWINQHLPSEVAAELQINTSR